MSAPMQAQEKTSPQPAPSLTPVRTRLLQRRCACGGAPGPDGECAECRRKRFQRRSINQAEPSTVPPIVQEVLRSPGQPLDRATRSAMEGSFSHDFSRVRVHTDMRAAESARAMNARAYTVGETIVFGARQFAPGTNNGLRLLAHELTHVVQQSGRETRAEILRVGQPGDQFEHGARMASTAVMRGERPTVTAGAPLVPQLQKEDLRINDFETTDILPQQALESPDYIDKGIVDARLREHWRLLTVGFAGLSIFYSDGSVLDLPAVNSVFPNLRKPVGPVLRIYRRHLPSGKIFPITLPLSEMGTFPETGTAEQVEAEALNRAQFVFDTTVTPNILRHYGDAITRRAFAFAGEIAQIWSAGLGARGLAQMLTVAQTARVMAAGRTALGVTSATAGRTTLGGVVQATVAAIRRLVLKNTLSGAQLQQVQQVEARLMALTQRAIQNVNSGTATGAWAQRLTATPANSPLFRTIRGNAYHEEAFNLVQQEVAAGTLPAGLRTNVGRAIPNAGLTNSYGGLRPDIRLPLGGGAEAVWDITTAAQAGHAQPYANLNFVRYVAELLY